MAKGVIGTVKAAVGGAVKCGEGVAREGRDEGDARVRADLELRT
jgi:hypothetical protein